MDRNGTSGWPRVETTNLNLVSLNRIGDEDSCLVLQRYGDQREANIRDQKHQLNPAV